MSKINFSMLANDETDSVLSKMTDMKYCNFACSFVHLPAAQGKPWPREGQARKEKDEARKEETMT